MLSFGFRGTLKTDDAGRPLGVAQPSTVFEKSALFKYACVWLVVRNVGLWSHVPGRVKGSPIGRSKCRSNQIPVVNRSQTLANTLQHDHCLADYLVLTAKNVALGILSELENSNNCERRLRKMAVRSRVRIAACQARVAQGRMIMSFHFSNVGLLLGRESVALTAFSPAQGVRVLVSINVGNWRGD
jgi:hypothetical protein